MANSITDNYDLVRYDVLSRSSISRLGDSDARYDQWAQRHETAYTKVLEIIKRSRSIEVSDLDDPTELKQAVCFYVAYLAFRLSLTDADAETSEGYYRLFTKELSEVRLSVGGVELPADPLQNNARIIIS